MRIPSVAIKTCNLLEYMKRFKINILYFTVAIFFVCNICLLGCQPGFKEVNFKLYNIDENSPKDPWAKICADLNSDGLQDIIIGGRKGPMVWYKSPTWEKYQITDGGYNTVDGESVDLNGDGFNDVVMGGLFWYENPGVLDSNPNAIWKSHKIADHPTHDVEIADINNDGLLDIITRNQTGFKKKGNTVHIWYQTRQSSWNEKVIDCTDGEGLCCNDIDNDGDPDIIIGGIWFENPGSNQTVSWIEHIYSDWHPAVSVAVSDLNKDGRKDIVLSPSEYAKEYYRISWFEAPKNIQNGIWNEHIIYDSIECVIHSLQIADFNKDKKPDIVYAEMHQGADPDEVVLLLNKNKGSDWVKKILSEQGSHSLELIDFDADKDIDFIGANWSGPFQPVQLWENLLNQKSK